MAPTLVSLFEEAAHALAELSADVASDAPVDDEVQVELTARDHESLLVAWLNELIFLGETRRLAFDAPTLSTLEGEPAERPTRVRLVATAKGRRPSQARTAVKAATMHNLRICPTNGGVEATIVLDV